MQTLSEGQIAGKFLKWTGFTGVENFNRVVATNSGKYFAIEQLETLLKNPQNKFARSQLIDIIPGIDIDTVITRGYLTEKELLKAGYIVNKETQFLYRIEDLPLKWRDSPMMKVAL